MQILASVMLSLSPKFWWLPMSRLKSAVACESLCSSGAGLSFAYGTSSLSWWLLAICMPFLSFPKLDTMPCFVSIVPLTRKLPQVTCMAHCPSIRSSALCAMCMTQNCGSRDSLCFLPMAFSAENWSAVLCVCPLAEEVDCFLCYSFWNTLLLGPCLPHGGTQHTFKQLVKFWHLQNVYPSLANLSEMHSPHPQHRAWYFSELCMAFFTLASRCRFSQHYI